MLAAIESNGITSGAFALGGAIVGGLATMGAQWRSDQRRESREGAASDHVVMGVGRVVEVYLLRWRAVVSFGREDPMDWWAKHLEPTPEWSHSDLQTLAARLETNDWNAVRKGLLAVDLLIAQREACLTEDQSFASMMEKTNDDGEIVSLSYMKDLRAGADALKASGWA